MRDEWYRRVNRIIETEARCNAEKPRHRLRWVAPWNRFSYCARTVGHRGWHISDGLRIWRT